MSRVFDRRRPLVFAHRGGAALAPENTLAAFTRALSLGVDGLECDVHLARDGVPVVIHDRLLDRTADARGPVAARTSAELARVDAGHHHYDANGGHPFRGLGLGVPPLEEVLRIGRDVTVIVELKTADLALAEAVVRLVRRLDAVERVCIGSFHGRALAAVRALDPAIVTSASPNETRWTLYRSWLRWPFSAARAYDAFQVPERSGTTRVISPRFVHQAHREGHLVQAWVVDTMDDCRRLLSWGVDGLISDRPDVALQARDAHLGVTVPSR